MDVTTVSLGTKTRENLAAYRDAGGYPNYNQAIQALLANASRDKNQVGRSCKN